jgi:hypothetical protein
MKNVNFIEVTDPLTHEVHEYAVIDNGNDSVTTMLKSEYEELAANEDQAI